MTRILRLNEALEKRGITRTPFYKETKSGLMTAPVKVGSGGRAVGWPEYEVEAVLKARIGGATDDELRRLVQRLHDERKANLAEFLCANESAI